ncbi:NUDIX domain-containing protein [Kitasatospora sp. NPDC002965]|uniref:NUDIX hydrolase n=1 Tax=Kitasatospora sp. NPDC002965 TaxID=3154775 RepID=UPI0033BF76A2
MARRRHTGERPDAADLDGPEPWARPAETGAESVTPEERAGTETQRHTGTERRAADRADAPDAGILYPVVGVIVTDPEGRILLVRRSPDEIPAGIWEIPGGSVDEGEDVEDGARRELAEETGIAGAEFTGYAGAVDFTTVHGLRARRHVFTARVPAGQPVALSDEHDRFTWAAPGDERVAALRTPRP